MQATRFNPFPRVSGTYGAPMGRASRNPGFDEETALCVAGPAGEYDSGGAYWGLGGREGPVWAVWARGRGREGVVYVRARSRDAAKRKAIEC